MDASAPYAIFTLTIPGSIALLRPVLVELLARGWRVSIIAGEGPARKNVLPPGVELIRIGMSRAITPGQDLVALTRMTRLLRQERPDLVVGSTPKASMLGMLAARLAGVPRRLFLIRGAKWDGMPGRKGDMLRRLDRLTAHNATDMVAVSDSLADLFVTSGVSRRRPTVLGYGGSKGVDVVTFHPGARVPRDHPRICYLGRLAEDKGIQDVLTVHDRCRNLVPGTELLIGGVIDPAQPVSQETIDGLSAPGVTWLGPVTDVPGVLRSSDLLIFPSLREGLPNVVIEAAACGVPTVGYRATGVVDAVQDGVTGRLVDLGDVDALSQATAELLQSDQRAEMGVAAREMAVSRFAQDKVVGTFADYLAELVRTSAGTTPRSAEDHR